MYIVDTSIRLLRDHDEDYKNCWGMWIIFQRSAAINCPPPQWKKIIKSKKLIFAICQIDLTWLVPVILLHVHVLECKGSSRLHFVLLIYFNRFFFLLHNIKRCFIVPHILRYEIIRSIQFPPMNVPCAFTDNKMAFLFLICWVCHAEWTMRVMCGVVIFKEFLIILIKINDKFNVDSSFK